MQRNYVCTVGAARARKSLRLGRRRYRMCHARATRLVGYREHRRVSGGS